jgi:beta-lactamase class A
MFPFSKKQSSKETENNPKKVVSRKKKEKREIPVVWTAKERLVIFFVLALTVSASAILGSSAREWKLPGIPRIEIPKISFEGTIILEGNKESQNEVDATQVIRDFKKQTKDLSGVYGFFVYRLGREESYGVSENEVFEAASLIKLPVLVALYKEAEAGNIDLDERYVLKDEDKVGGAGGLQYNDAGTKVSWRRLAELMGQHSDNTAFNIVRNKLGTRKIQETINFLGLTKTSLEENETSLADIAVIFERLWGDEVLTQEHSQEILDYLTETDFEDYLAAGVPEGVRVAHKYGREVHVLNDAGVVYTDQPFVLVLMSKGVVESEASEAFPELAHLIYQFETEGI